ncbi:hypothetical protein STAL104432_22235 [Streptomyces albus]
MEQRYENEIVGANMRMTDVAAAAARDAVRRHLEAEGVGCAVYYPTPIHRLKPYAHLGAELPVTDRAAAEVLSLPVHPSLTPGDLDQIVAAVTRAAGKAGVTR